MVFCTKCKSINQTINPKYIVIIFSEYTHYNLFKSLFVLKTGMLINYTFCSVLKSDNIRLIEFDYNKLY